MSLHEIEETLHTLKSRHPGLDEGMLVTLLRAGGWEESKIADAKALFQGVISEDDEKLPPIQESPVLPPVADESHLIPEKIEEKKEELQSLVVEAPVAHKEEIPHNLPLRPFETSDHVWPFSRYRDVFYGEEILPPAPEKKEEVKTPVRIDQPIPVFNRPQDTTSKIEVHVTPTPLSKGDQKLVLLASAMLVIILFLLGYMYGNGRL